LSGNAAAAATTSAKASADQNSGDDSGASIAPGTASITRLSTSSITAMDAVSASRARPAAWRSGMPLRSSGNMVNA
jgi:hypothetical protein